MQTLPETLKVEETLKVAGTETLKVAGTDSIHFTAKKFVRRLH